MQWETNTTNGALLRSAEKSKTRTREIEYQARIWDLDTSTSGVYWIWPAAGSLRQRKADRLETGSENIGSRETSSEMNPDPKHGLRQNGDEPSNENKTSASWKIKEIHI
jgi:hypothetical protein